MSLIPGRTGSVTTAEDIVFDLEEKVDSYVRSLAEEHATNVLWWDMRGEHMHIIEFKHMYNRFKVRVRTNSIVYGEFRNISINSKLVHTEWFHSEQSTDPQQVRLAQAIQRHRSEAWRTERGLSYVEEPISLDIGVTEIGLNAKIPLSDGSRRNVIINHSKQQEYTEMYLISVDQNLTVRPKTSLQIDWVVTDIAQISLPFLLGGLTSRLPFVLSSLFLLVGLSSRFLLFFLHNAIPDILDFVVRAHLDLHGDLESSLGQAPLLPVALVSVELTLRLNTPGPVVWQAALAASGLLLSLDVPSRSSKSCTTCGGTLTPTARLCSEYADTGHHLLECAEHDGARAVLKAASAELWFTCGTKEESKETKGRALKGMHAHLAGGNWSAPKIRCVR
ncbi:hypothetical protein ISCGN_016694 [Ixodes scapularis]